MQDYSQRLLDFIKESPSCFHVIDNIRARLLDAGFTELYEADGWALMPGGRYFTARNGSSLMAFRIPEEGKADGFMTAAAHSDSPTFRLKDTPELEGGIYTRINTERYGGMILDSWFDRPLSVAGRLIVRDGNIIRPINVCADEDLLLIPRVAIHQQNPTDGIKYNPAVDLIPLFGDGTARGHLMEVMAGAAGIDANAILGHDLYLYNRQPGSIWGWEKCYVSSPKLDDLQCVFAGLEGFLSTDSCRAIPVLMIADNEEVGSRTRQGAGSTFLADTLGRICDALGMDLRCAIVSSMLLSADNAHAVHPNHPEFEDPIHRPKMNAGVVMKFAASQTYTTDGITAALFKTICDKAEVPLQVFHNRSDLRGGSTLGNIATGSVSMKAVDIGLAQLAMHSAYETAGTKDTAYMIAVMKTFFEAAIRSSGENHELIF